MFESNGHTLDALELIAPALGTARQTKFHPAQNPQVLAHVTYSPISLSIPAETGAVVNRLLLPLMSLRIEARIHRDYRPSHEAGGRTRQEGDGGGDISWRAIVSQCGELSIDVRPGTIRRILIGVDRPRLY